MIDTTQQPRHTPTSSLLLFIKYLQETNPVTKWSYKQTIERRIKRGEFSDG